MNRFNIRKIPAAFVVAALLFVTVFSCAGIASAESTFSPRLLAPSKSDAYYYSDKNIFYKFGYGMPNCTAYAYGRAYEILGKEPKLCPYDAQEWFDYNKENKYYTYGQTPKLGAIACWSYKNGGHVAVVEEIENDTITFSNSAYGYLEFYLTTASVDDENPGQDSWEFQGYIYIGDFVAPEEDNSEVEGYPTGVYEVSVDDSLNMRSGAGTGYPYVQSLFSGDRIEITQVKQADGYVWGYTNAYGLDGWVALDFCNYISPLPSDEPEEPITPTIPDFSGYEFNDVNRDGVVDISDATSVQMYLAQLTYFDDEQKLLADFDNDGTVNINDATMLQMYLSFK